VPDELRALLGDSAAALARGPGRRTFGFARCCHVPVSPRQRMGESGAHINDRGMGA
jgi:hypothetical protein